MAKYNIDDILSELGVQKGDEATRRLPKEARKQHTIDRAEDAFSPVPAMPGNQKVYQTADEADRALSLDPAVKNRPESAPGSTIGPALAAVYTPDRAPASPGPIVAADLGGHLLATGVVNAEQLTAAQNIIRQSPGRSLIEILIEQGIEEAGSSAASPSSRVPFERIDLEKGSTAGSTARCSSASRRSSASSTWSCRSAWTAQRAVIGAVNADDVFLIDDIKQRLGIQGVKMVVVTAFDIKGALEIVGAGSTADDQADLSQILYRGRGGRRIRSRRRRAEVDLEQQAGEGPVIRYVNYIIQTAPSRRAHRTSTSSPREEAQGALPHRRRALRDDEPAGAMGARRSPAASRSWRTSTSPSAACRRTDASAAPCRAASSTCVCRRSPTRTARRPSCASSTRVDQRQLEDLGFERTRSRSGRSRSMRPTASSSSPVRPARARRPRSTPRSASSTRTR
jgi:hypothetical protein